MWEITCHVGSHSVTCHLTQVNVSDLNPGQAGKYLISVPWWDERLSVLGGWTHRQVTHLSSNLAWLGVVESIALTTIPNFHL